MKSLKISLKKFTKDTLERYTGSKVKDFQPYILLANFESYLEKFAANTNNKIIRGSAMEVCHAKKDGITIIRYGVGSPLAAMIIELLALVKPKAVLMLGYCGGLRENYKIGEYFNPVAAIREEGTSMAYLPERCPSLSSFVIQRFVCEELERQKIKYRTGVIHTTNVRLWEFKEDFKANLIKERSQAIDMECATLFTVGFSCQVPIGALMLITDMPLLLGGIKTKKSAKEILLKHANNHLQIGINVLKNMRAKENNGFGYQF